MGLISWKRQEVQVSLISWKRQYFSCISSTSFLCQHFLPNQYYFFQALYVFLEAAGGAGESDQLEAAGGEGQPGSVGDVGFFQALYGFHPLIIRSEKSMKML